MCGRVEGACLLLIRLAGVVPSGLGGVWCGGLRRRRTVESVDDHVRVLALLVAVGNRALANP